MKIKKKYGCKLILDYGDPWSFNPSQETVPNFRKRIDFIFEKTVLKYADHVTVTTKETLSKYSEIFKIKNSQISLIRQGVDTKKYEEVINIVKNSKYTETQKTITLFYSGIFYKDIRNPEIFFKALSLIDPSKFGSISLEINIAGKMEEYFLEYISSLKFPSKVKVNILGNVEFEKIIDMQVRCDALLYFGNKGKVQVPGKLYEYIAARRPIFAISPEYDESSEIITNSNRGIVVKDDVEDIKENLEQFLNNLVSKKMNYNLEKNTTYDWMEISKEYKAIVDRVIEEN